MRREVIRFAFRTGRKRKRKRERERGLLLPFFHFSTFIVENGIVVETVEGVVEEVEKAVEETYP